MPERYVLGIDGGQTGTTCLIARSDGQIVGRGAGGHLLHLRLPEGPQTMRRAFQEAAAQAWSDAHMLPQNVAAAYLGLSGIEAGTSEAALAQQIAAQTIQAGSIVAANDGTSALAGALIGRPGVIVIAGTGAIALGVNESGQEAFSGGWGWLLGDEGSAFDIGRRGLLSAIHAWDGRGPSNLLAPRLQAHFHAEHYFDIKRIVFSGPLDARVFAALAPLVVQAARDGDVVAGRIVRSAARELARAAAAVIGRLGFRGPEVRVSYAGGVFRAGALVLRPFRAELRSLQPAARVAPPALPGSCGSLLLALRISGDLNEATIARLVASSAQLGWSAIE